MTIGILGAASVGLTLASRLVGAGRPVILANSRGPDSLTELSSTIGPLATGGTAAQAARASTVFLAVPWTQVEAVLAPLGPWDDRILVDTTNIFLNYAPDFEVAQLGDETGSEIVARLAPGARVVKALNTLPVAKLLAPTPSPDLRRVIFLAGDHPEANAEVAAEVTRMGLAPVDLGGLQAGGQLMQLGGPLSGLELFQRA
jgi:predicted dinucleotide-binding enzyme